MFCLVLFILLLSQDTMITEPDLLLGWAYRIPFAAHGSLGFNGRTKVYDCDHDVI